jgi:hypothetical protein
LVFVDINIISYIISHRKKSFDIVPDSQLKNALQNEVDIPRIVSKFIIEVWVSVLEKLRWVVSFNKSNHKRIQFSFFFRKFLPVLCVLNCNCRLTTRKKNSKLNIVKLIYPTPPLPITTILMFDPEEIFHPFLQVNYC